MNKKIKLPKYLKLLLSHNPKIASGRKNFSQYNYRIIKTLDLINKYFNIKINKK